MTQVFLSHSTLDNEFVDRLAGDLRAAGIVVWKAPDSILPGEEWVDAIQRGLETSSHFVLVKSPNAVKSKWVKFEFGVALRRYHDEKMTIIPIHHEACDAPEFWLSFQDVKVENYTRGMMELMQRLGAERPENPPMPAPPETTVINVNIVGGITGHDVFHEGPDVGRPVFVVEPVSFNTPDLSTILPLPFEWCEISSGQVTLDDVAGTFDVSPFYLAKYPITYAQYQVFIDAPDGFYFDQWWEGLTASQWHRRAPREQQLKIDMHPRVRVSWWDSMVFCRWLSQNAKANIRLPTEVEWQLAAQGADDRSYPWGNRFVQAYCNTKESNFSRTTRVDRYPQGASPFAVLDMCGNVWEWCLNPIDNPSEVDLNNDEMRALRGGSWFDNAVDAHNRFRGRRFPDKSSDTCGFRIAWFPSSE